MSFLPPSPPLLLDVLIGPAFSNGPTWSELASGPDPAALFTAQTTGWLAAPGSGVELMPIRVPAPELLG